MSDNYDPLATQTTAFTFRRLDALQDAVSAFGKTASGAPVALLVANDGTLQTRKLNRLTDEILLVGTDPNAIARALLVDTQGRLLRRALSALPVSDFDGVRAYFLGPAATQVQGKADPDGTLNVHDPVARASLADLVSRFDVPHSAVLDAILTDQARHVTNFPLDFPDQLSQARLQSLLAQVDRALSEIYDVRSAHGAVTAAQNSAGLTVTLDLGPTGRPTVQRFISLGGSASASVQASRDGATWRTLETQTTTLSPLSSIASVQGLGYRFVRVASASTGVALEFEISAAR